MWPLRLVLGVVFLLHGSQKLFGWFGGFGIDGTASFLANYSVPAPVFFAWVLALVEFLGGIALILGLLVCVAATLLALDMIVATFLVHWSGGFFMQNGGVEFTLLLLAALVAVIFLGSGPCSLDGRLGWPACCPFSKNCRAKREGKEE